MVWGLCFELLGFRVVGVFRVGVLKGLLGLFGFEVLRLLRVCQDYDRGLCTPKQGR